MNKRMICKSVTDDIMLNFTFCNVWNASNVLTVLFQCDFSAIVLLIAVYFLGMETNCLLSY